MRSWVTAIVLASVAVAAGSLGYVAVTYRRTGAAVRDDVLRHLQQTSADEYTSRLGRTSLVFPATAWQNAREVGLDFTEVVRRTSDATWLVLDDVARELGLATIYVTSLYRATGTGPHTRGNAVDIGYVQRPGEPLVLLKRTGGIPTTEPALAQQLRKVLASSPYVTQVLGPWWMHTTTTDRPNNSTSPLDVGHLTHVHVTTREADRVA